MNIVDLDDIKLQTLRTAPLFRNLFEKSLPNTSPMYYAFFGPLHQIVLKKQSCNWAQAVVDCERKITPFFLNWYAADTQTSFAVRRRLANQAIKNVTTGDLSYHFWNTVVEHPALSQYFASKELLAFKRQRKKEQYPMKPLNWADKMSESLLSGKSVKGLFMGSQEQLLDVLCMVLEEQLSVHLHDYAQRIDVDTSGVFPTAVTVEKITERRALNETLNLLSAHLGAQ